MTIPARGIGGAAHLILPLFARDERNRIIRRERLTTGFRAACRAATGGLWRTPTGCLFRLGGERLRRDNRVDLILAHRLRRVFAALRLLAGHAVGDLAALILYLRWIGVAVERHRRLIDGDVQRRISCRQIIDR